MCLYYNYKLNYNKDKEQKKILIQEVYNLPYKKFVFEVPFDTNQSREIYLKAKFDFRESEALDEWMFEVKNVVTFFSKNDSDVIFFQKNRLYSDSLMEYWLLHIVFPIYFTLTDTYYFLHTGSVEIENRAVLFMGDSFAGKSTLTDYFLKQKHPLVTDDKLPTFYEEETFYCVNSHPYHRPYRKLEDLGIKAKNVSQGKLAIGNIYWLHPVAEDAEVSIKEIKGLKKFECLRYATEMDIYVHKKKRFEYITKLANTLHIYEINVPRKLERLEEVYTAIVKHTQNGEL